MKWIEVSYAVGFGNPVRSDLHQPLSVVSI